jgi:predicted amidohydrolase YtcJ
MGRWAPTGPGSLSPTRTSPRPRDPPQVPPEDLEETAEISFRHGFQLNTRAIRDRGTREALDVYEAIIGSGGPGADMRWRIEHAQNLHPDEVPRFARLGVIPSMQGVHATLDDPWVPPRLGEDRARERT